MSYAYHRSLTIDHTQCGTSDSSSFAVLVKLDSSNVGTTMKTAANGGHIQNTVTQTGGNPVTMPADLIFTSDAAGANKLPWEIDFYDGTGGTLWAWVQLSTVSHSSNTVFYVYYDDPTVTTQQNVSSFAPSAVWNSNYTDVYHIPDGNTLYGNDSTVNNVALVSNTGVTAGTGKIDGGVVTPGGQLYFTNSILPTNFPGSFIVSCWVKTTSNNSGFLQIQGGSNVMAIVFGIGSYGAGALTSHCFDPLTNDDNGTSVHINGTVVIDDGNWHLVHLVRNTGSNIQSYVDGNLDGTTTFTSTAQFSVQNKFLFLCGWAGVTSIAGTIDEARLFNGLPTSTANWILTEYNNQNNPESFVTAGSETGRNIFSPFPSHFYS